MSNGAEVCEGGMVPGWPVVCDELLGCSRGTALTVGLSLLRPGGGVAGCAARCGGSSDSGCVEEDDEATLCSSDVLGTFGSVLPAVTAFDLIVPTAPTEGGLFVERERVTGGAMVSSPGGDASPTGRDMLFRTTGVPML